MTIFTLAQAAPAATTTTTTAPAPTPAPQSQESSGGLGGFLGGDMMMFVICIVLFWVVLIRPQRKAAKEQEARLAALERGNKVVTNAGIHGMIEKVNESTVNLKIAEGVIIEVEKQAIVRVDK